MPPTLQQAGLAWWVPTLPQRQPPRPVSRPLALHAAEMPARHYLASRGARPQQPQPLHRALPMLLRELRGERTAGHRQVVLGLALMLVALVLLATGLFSNVALAADTSMGPDLPGLLRLVLHPLAGLVGVVWAGTMLTQAVARLRRAGHIRRLLRQAKWPAAFTAALH